MHRARSPSDACVVSQVEELQRVRLQLEGQVEDLAAKLKDVDAENGQLKVSMRRWLHGHAIAQ